MNVKLNVARASGEIKEISLRKPVTILGRGADCDLRIPIEGCSRQHCEIRLENDRVFVKDLDSSNGTYINNEKIAEAEIEAGDALAIGPVIIRFRINGEPEELPPLPPTMAPSSDYEEEIEEIYEEDDEDYEEDNEETVDTVSEEYEEDEVEEDEEEYEVDVEEDEEEDDDEDEEDDPFAALARESGGGGDALDALAAASGGEDDAKNALDALADTMGDKKKKKKKKKEEDD